MTIISLARLATEQCLSNKDCIMCGQYCPLNVFPCSDVNEEDWIDALNNNDRLLTYIEKQYGKK